MVTYHNKVCKLLYHHGVQRGAFGGVGMSGGGKLEAKFKLIVYRGLMLALQRKSTALRNHHYVGARWMVDQRRTSAPRSFPHAQAFASRPKLPSHKIDFVRVLGIGDILWMFILRNSYCNA